LNVHQKMKDSLACFVRVFSDLTENLSSKEARNFIDLPWGSSQADQEAQELMNDLRDKQVPSCLSPSKVIRRELKWAERGVDPNLPEHQAYLQDFLDTFYEIVTMMISRASRQEEKQLKAFLGNPVLEEVLRHLSFCRARCESFHGREEVLQVIQGHLSGREGAGEVMEEEPNCPFVLFGESGCGKTSLMARAVQMAIQEGQGTLNSRGHVVAVRFLGTTADSTDLHKLLRSISSQIWMAYGQDLSSLPSDHQELVEFFKEQVLSLGTRDRPLYLFLDSLDQLSPAYNSYAMGWIPKSLPPHNHLVVSSLPKENGCLENLRSLLSRTQTPFYQVPVLPPNVGIEMMDKWLDKEGLTLTTAQREIVAQALEACSLPLYLRLVFNEAKRWKSYTPAEEIFLPPTIQGMIEQLFVRIENQHGRVLVSHAFGFITASKAGLAETELEDLLSIDDQVLQDVFQYWLPPVRRLPPLLWTRIRADIEDYLTEKDADGSLVVYWYHRQFIEVALRRYLGGGEAWGTQISDLEASGEEVASQKHALSLHLHRLLAEYFQGTWAHREKPFLYTEKQVRFFGLKEATSQADRRVSPQPLFYAGESRPNMRKISNLPYHMILSGNSEELRKRCLCNFEFLRAKMLATSTDDVLADFALALSKVPEDEELALVRDAIRLCASTMVSKPLLFPIEIAGRLSGFVREEGPFQQGIKPLVTQAREYCRANHLLTPYLPCFLPPGGLLRSTLEGHPSKITQASFSLDGSLLVSSGGDIRIWDTAGGSLIHIIEEKCDHLLLSPARPLFAFLSESKIFCYSIETGEPALEFEGSSLFDLADTFDISPDDRLIAVKACRGPFCKTITVVWDFHSGKLLRLLQGNTGSLSCIRFSPCGKWIATVGDNSIIWDLQSFQRAAYYSGPASFSHVLLMAMRLSW